MALLNDRRIAAEVTKYVCCLNGPFVSLDALATGGNAEVLSSLAEIDAESFVTVIDRQIDPLSIDQCKLIGGDLRRQFVCPTRLPVPILIAHRPPFVPAAATSWDPFPMSTDAVPPGGMAEAAAKAAIEADGYKGVRALGHGPDGVWKARALRGETEVLLRVDRTGNVSAN